MEKNPHNQGVLTKNFIGIGPVTREMIHARASELALIAGRVPPQIEQADYEQAQRELAGGPELDRRESVLESIPETDRWNPVPAYTGSQTPDSSGEDEDDEGRSVAEQLVEEGVEEARRDQRLQAALAAEKDQLDQA